MGFAATEWWCWVVLGGPSAHVPLLWQMRLPVQLLKYTSLPPPATHHAVFGISPRQGDDTPVNSRKVAPRRSGGINYGAFAYRAKNDTDF